MLRPSSIILLFLTFEIWGLAIPDTADRILILYRLSSSQEVQFCDHDSVMSPFWTAWNSNTPTNTSLDFIDMQSDNAAYSWNRCAVEPFNGSKDARVKIQGTYGKKGVYLQILFDDDSYVAYTGWATDVLDIYTDAMPTDSVTAMDWFNPTQWSLSFSCRNFQLPIGSQMNPPGIMLRYYDNVVICITDPCNGGPIPFGSPVFDSMTAEILQPDSAQKLTELFIPWSQWAVSDTPSLGKKLAFALGYNDVDLVVPDCVNSLRWQGLCDPYCEPPRMNVWGDVELGPCLDPNGCSSNIRNPLRLQNQFSTDFHSTGRLFTLKGERISPTCNLPQKGRIFIREIIGNDGFKQAQIQPIGAK